MVKREERLNRLFHPVEPFPFPHFSPSFFSPPPPVAKNGEWGYNGRVMEGKDKIQSSKSTDEIREKILGLKCLANEHRLGIVIYLKAKKSASVGEIADQLKISFKATSKHLAILTKAGILVCQSDNPFVIYSLSPNPAKFIRHLLLLL